MPQLKLPKMFLDGLISDGTVNFNLPNVVDAVRYSSPLSAQPDFGSSPLHRLLWILSQLYLSGNGALNQSISADLKDSPSAWLDWNPFDLNWSASSVPNLSAGTIKSVSAELLSLSNNSTFPHKLSRSDIPQPETIPEQNAPINTNKSPVLHKLIEVSQQSAALANSQQDKIKVQKDEPVLTKRSPAQSVTIDGKINIPLLASISPFPSDDDLSLSVATPHPPYFDFSASRLPTAAVPLNKAVYILEEIFNYLQYLSRGIGLGWFFNTVTFLAGFLVSFISGVFRSTLIVFPYLFHHASNIVTFAFQAFGLDIIPQAMEDLVGRTIEGINSEIEFLLQVAEVSGFSFLSDMAGTVIQWIGYFIANILHVIFFAMTVVVYKVMSIVRGALLSFLDFNVFFIRGIGLGWLIDSSLYVATTFLSTLNDILHDIFLFASDAEIQEKVPKNKEGQKLKSDDLFSFAKVSSRNIIESTARKPDLGAFSAFLLLSFAISIWFMKPEYGTQISTKHLQSILTWLTRLSKGTMRSMSEKLKLAVISEDGKFYDSADEAFYDTEEESAMDLLHLKDENLSFSLRPNSDEFWRIEEPLPSFIIQERNQDFSVSAISLKFYCTCLVFHFHSAGNKLVLRDLIWMATYHCIYIYYIL